MKPTTNIAVRAARQAGSILMRYFEHLDSLKVVEKNKNDYVTEVDRGAEQAIISTIRQAYPEHAILAEETGDHDGNDFQWVIDPLDGTTNYLHGFPQFSISIALKHRGVLESAVVYDPLKDELFTADKGNGAYLNERRIRINNQKTLSGALIGTGIPFRDRRFIDQYLGMLKDMTQDTAGIRRPGSAALDFAWLAAGRIDGFWELGLSQWDFAAGALLVKEAGGTVTDLNGGDKYLETGNVVASNVKLQSEMLSLIKPHLSDQLKA
ncbi:MAG: inositol monophosphatase family protein [Gammaproteobacteria bacterium]|jgi:myo-inositol-1(or 4)-monophosphatase